MPTLKLIPASHDKRCKLPTISLRIAGLNRHFVIDTGAETTILSPALKPVLNQEQIQRTYHVTHQGFAGSAQAPAIPVKFTLIGVRITEVVFDPSIDTLRADGLNNCYGVIGNDILQQFRSVEFSWKEGIVRFNI